MAYATRKTRYTMSDLVGAANLTAFPVLFIDKNGFITGKNTSAKKQILGMRIGTNLLKRSVSEGENTIFLPDQPVFKKAVIINIDDCPDRRIAVFPMVLQNGDNIKKSARASELSSDEVFGGIDATDVSRYENLYETLTDVFSKYRRSNIGSDFPCNVYDLCRSMSSRLNFGMRSNGKRCIINTKDKVKKLKLFPIDERVFDDVMAIGLYISISRSETGTVGVTVDYDEEQSNITIVFMSRLPPEDAELYGVFDIPKTFPECAAEVYIARALGAPEMKCMISDLIMEIRAEIPNSPDAKPVLSNPISLRKNYVGQIFCGFIKNLNASKHKFG